MSLLQRVIQSTAVRNFINTGYEDCCQSCFSRRGTIDPITVSGIAISVCARCRLVLSPVDSSGTSTLPFLALIVLLRFRREVEEEARSLQIAALPTASRGDFIIN